MSYHQCFIPKNKIEELENQDNLPKVFVFFDIETIVNDDFQHIPNALCSITTCEFCSFDPITKNFSSKFCHFCNFDQNKFLGFDCLEKFVKYLFDDLNTRLEIRRKNMKLKSPIQINVISHYGKAFDIQFINNYCLQNNFIIKNQLRRGTKILSMNIKHIKFLDSHNFLPMPLKSLPKSFGIDNLNKGYFAHKFNKPINFDLIQNKLPEIEYYEPQYMKENERKDFINWYEKNKKTHFDFNEELIKYCFLDVEILARCIICFRDLWKSIFGIDIFTRNITLAQSVFEVYKTIFMTPNSIARISDNIYERKRRQSFISNVWLDLMQKSRQHEIIREFKLYNYYVDGFIPNTKEIFEYNGCLFHACIKCYPQNTHPSFNPFNGESFQSIREKNEEKEIFFQKSRIQNDHNYRL